MDTPPLPRHPLRDGNRLQRAYYRWAVPHYERIGRTEPRMREQIEEIDQLLYTRQGAGLWLGLLGAIGGTAFALHGTKLGWTGALTVATLLWVGMGIVALAAWLNPTSGGWNRKKLRRFALALVIGAPLGGLAGFVVGHVAKRGQLDLPVLLERLENALPTLIVSVGAATGGLLLLALAVGWASRQLQARRLAQVQLLAERDAARASAAEADMRLLQAQIHPHFVFNTLATLQHWVDKKDDRAAALLRELTGFLRRSTEMLGRPRVPLAEEMQAVSHYLAILQARQGDRLRFTVDMDARTATQALPPGLLLTLVENAVEHGLETKIGGGTVAVQSACEGTGWWLRVDDDGHGLSPTAQDNVGLSNLRQRLQQHFAGNATFFLRARPEGGTRAEIRFQETPCPAS